MIEIKRNLKKDTHTDTRTHTNTHTNFSCLSGCVRFALLAKHTLVGGALGKVLPLFPYLHFKTSRPAANTPLLINF